jgi:hypothetical protein
LASALFRGALIAFLACAPSLGAQRTVSSVDVSGASVWYSDTIRAAGASVSPALRIDWSHGTLAASGDVSGLGGGNTSLQGTISPSLFTSASGPFFGELTASMGGSTHRDGTRTGQTIALARAYLAGDRRGAWIGGGAGATWDGAEWRGVRQGELGAWLDHEGVTTLATLSPVVVSDSIRYVDLQTALRYPARNYELGVSVGVRSGASGPAVGGTSRAWGSASLLRWIAPRLAIVGSAGSYPVDLTQGFPGGRFLSLALRVVSRNSRSVDESRPPATTAGAAALDIVSAGNRRTFRLSAPQVRSVEITGDFTQWQPVALTRGSDGVWSVTLPIVRGTYQMNLRIDRGAWAPPPGLLTTRDEFGGVSGILTIE